MTINPEVLERIAKLRTAKALAAQNGRDVLIGDTPEVPRLVYFRPQTHHIMRQVPQSDAALKDMKKVEPTGSFLDLPLVA